MIINKLFPFLDNDRRREIWVCKQLNSIPAGEKILDVGAGECKYKKYCSHLRYTSQDFGQYSGSGDNSGLQTGSWDTSRIDIISDITKIPVAKGSYDNILCTEVLEHVPYPDKAIKEISRILKKGGRLILTAPFCALTHMSPYFYCTGFSINWYREILTKNKLEIVELEANGDFFDFVSQELARLPLTTQKYSFLGPLAMVLYIPIIPLVIIISLVSRIAKGSEKQLCFGWHVLAKKC